MKDVDELAKKYNLDSDAHQRLHEFYHHKYGGEIHEDEEIIKELSLALKIVSFRILTLQSAVTTEALK